MLVVYPVSLQQLMKFFTSLFAEGVDPHPQGPSSAQQPLFIPKFPRWGRKRMGFHGWGVCSVDGSETMGRFDMIRSRKDAEEIRTVG
jgi:hypothetical protein